MIEKLLIEINRLKNELDGYSAMEALDYIESYINTLLKNKDTLLEWLDGKMTIEGATEGFVGGYDAALKDVIDKINSM